MRLFELTTNSVKQITKPEVESVLRKAGYENLKWDGNKLRVLVQIPDGAKKNQFRAETLKEVLNILKKLGGQYSSDPGLGSLGGVVFPNSPISIMVKDIGKQGDNSAGVANEIELANIIQSVIDKYGSANVTFVDPRGKTLSIQNATEVIVAGRQTAGGVKADVVLKGPKGTLPISIKKLDADMWESADSAFGKRARTIIDDLVAKGIVQIKQIASRNLKGVGTIPVYELSKEIVMEPTPEEALRAIFGTDLNPKGGVVVQTFKPEHFKQDGNNVTVSSHAVISSWEDIPESHLMVWLIRNNKDRNSESLGLAGLRPLGVTLTRGIGAKGTKDVILVDKNGNVVKRK